MIPLREQIQEVRRLVRLREAASSNWPGLTGISRAIPSDDAHLERLRAVLETLERLEAGDQ